MSDQTHNEVPAVFPQGANGFLLPGPAGLLEVVTETADPESSDKGVAILCHPHPEHGGNLRNKVVHILERALRELGLATVRFNFRGVGESGGEFADGFGETEDLLSIAGWVKKVRPESPLWLGGFSFGAWIAAKAAQKLSVSRLITVAPPVDRFDFDSLAAIDCPWLVVQGDEDEIVSPEEVSKWVESREPKPQLIMMDNSDHFFHRRLMDLRGVLKNGVKRQLS